jgi:hypothetical protein
MANGQQKAQENLLAFNAWKRTQSDDDFKQIVRGGILSRTQIAKFVGIGKSALRQNPSIRESLEALEDELRKPERGVLPDLTKEAFVNKDKPKVYAENENSRARDIKRLSELETENFRLKAENEALKSSLKRYKELSDVINEIGILPR